MGCMACTEPQCLTRVHFTFYLTFTYKYSHIYRVILSLEAPNTFGKSIPEFGETHSSVLGCESEPSAVGDPGSRLFPPLFLSL